MDSLQIVICTTLCLLSWSTGVEGLLCYKCKYELDGDEIKHKECGEGLDFDADAINTVKCTSNQESCYMRKLSGTGGTTLQIQRGCMNCDGCYYGNTPSRKERADMTLTCCSGNKCNAGSTAGYSGFTLSTTFLLTVLAARVYV